MVVVLFVTAQFDAAVCAFTTTLRKIYFAPTLARTRVREFHKLCLHLTLIVRYSMIFNTLRSVRYTQSYLHSRALIAHALAPTCTACMGRIFR